MATIKDQLSRPVIAFCDCSTDFSKSLLKSVLISHFPLWLNLSQFFQCCTATIIIACIVVKAVFVDSAENRLCTFPSSSIACKIWNYTNMDCSRRELVCIPLLSHKVSLELLDLSNNKLSVLYQDSFSGLIKLKTLDLSSNNISTINGDTFIQLNSLQTLDMSQNSLQSLSDDVFSELLNLKNLYLNENADFSVKYRMLTGLGKLQTLDLTWTMLDFTRDSRPFKDLHSLRTLSLITDLYQPFVLSSPIFTGLNQTLEVLNIFVGDMKTYTPFVQLSSLQYLNLQRSTCSYVNGSFFVGLGNLKHLVLTNDVVDCVLDFSPLVSLTRLTYFATYGLRDFYTHIQPLKSLDSPLQTLELYFTISSVRFNSTTFESLPKWKESLQELNIYPSVQFNIRIEGSPFKWFPKLQRLTIQGFPDPELTINISWTSPVDTFKGLTNLSELNLNYISIDAHIAYAVLSAFANSSLKTLDLAYNNIYVNYSIVCKIGSISTLKTINVSHNFNRRRHLAGNLYLPRLCNKNFSLLTLNINNLRWFVDRNGGRCPSLVSLDSSNSIIALWSSVKSLIHAPQLQNLYLSGIKIFGGFPSKKIKILKIFS